MSMTSPDLESYLSAVDLRMRRQGFVSLLEEAGDFQVNRLLRQREFSPIACSMIDTFCIVRCVAADLTGASVEQFSRQAFSWALKHKIWIPRGLGGGLFVYPVLVTPAAGEDVRSAITTYCPRHWAACEFPAVVDLSAKALLYYQDTPFWGAVFYKGIRKEVRELFLPE